MKTYTRKRVYHQKQESQKTKYTKNIMKQCPECKRVWDAIEIYPSFFQTVGLEKEICSECKKPPIKGAPK